MRFGRYEIRCQRTPKVNNRTASPALYVTMPWVIIIYSCMVFYADTLSRNWGNAVFAGFNAIVTFWALTAYIGIWHSMQDMVVGLVRWFFVPIKEPQQEAARKKALGVTPSTSRSSNDLRVPPAIASSRVGLHFSSGF